MARLRLAAGGALGNADINIGGIHHAPDRRQVLPYVFLSAGEQSALEQLREEVGDITARDLPGARPIDLSRLLGEDRRA
jgi:mannose/fructose/N-acetylgalactosamine-specific phosphotransferase system component IIB